MVTSSRTGQRWEAWWSTVPSMRSFRRRDGTGMASLSLRAARRRFWAQAAAVCQVYLRPPPGTVVICIDEKTGIQAKYRRYPEQPARPGRLARRESDYVRNGTVSIVAALEVATGQVVTEPIGRNDSASPAVDDQQQLLTDLTAVGAINFPRKRCHRQLARPPHRAGTLRHATRRGYAIGGTGEDAHGRAHAPAYPQLDALTRRRVRCPRSGSLQGPPGNRWTCRLLSASGPSHWGYDDATFPVSQLVFHDLI
jgi:hypothetical protein